MWRVGLALALLSCRPPAAKCPACPEAPPPQLITRTERCMDPLPDFPSVQLPPPGPDGKVVLDKSHLAALRALLSVLRLYLTSQYDRCGALATPDAGVADAAR